MHIEPLHCFKEKLKKTHQGKPQKYTKAAQNSADQKFKSADISKKAHNGAASSLSMEHFVLRGCFTTRLFSPVRITGILRTLRWEVSALHKEASRSTGGFQTPPQGKATWAPSRLVQECCYSTSDGIIIPWAHSRFAVVFLTLGFYRSFAASLWEMTSPALSSISLIQKAAFKRAFKVHFLMVL